MRFVFKIVIITAASIIACSVSKAQKSIQFSADVLTGFSKFNSTYKSYSGNIPGTIAHDNVYCNPSAYLGIGPNFRLNRISLGFDYYWLRYNRISTTRITELSSGKVIEEFKDVNFDDYYITRLNIGYELINTKKWQSALILGYAFPAINSWNLRSGYSTYYDGNNTIRFRFANDMCRASGYSISLNTGIVSKNEKSKISITLGSEWLSNNTPKRFQSDWMTMEKNEWYYSAGLRYSYLLKAWGKK